MSQRVPFGGRRPLDPRRSNVSIDGNVLNRGGSNEADRRIDRLLRLSNEGVINFVIGGGIRDEVLHPATPDEKKAVVVTQIFNLRPGRNSQQEADRRAVAAILQGNSKPETHTADASLKSDIVPCRLRANRRHARQFALISARVNPLELLDRNSGAELLISARRDSTVKSQV
jgi:hypothetical protein